MGFHSEGLALMQAELATLSFLKSGFQLEPIAGGTINASFCLRAGTTKFFVKTFADEGFTGLDRQYLFSLQGQLHKLHLTPEPVYLSTDNDFQIDMWCEGRNLLQSKIGRNKKLEKLLKVFAKLHGIGVKTLQLDLPKMWLRYIDYIERCPSSGSYKALQRNGLLAKLSDHADTWYSVEQSAFCHNDLSFEHVSDSERICVFDWEYAATSSPFYDLASCFEINGLSYDEQYRFCVDYGLEIGKNCDIVFEQVQKMLPLVSVTNQLWYCAAQCKEQEDTT